MNKPCRTMYRRYGMSKYQPKVKEKLSEQKVFEILRTVEERDKLRERLKNMTNKAMAVKYGVHVRTIDKAVAGFTWSRVV